MTRTLIVLSEWAYRTALVLLPGPFRRAHGGGLLQLFRDQCRAAAAARGVFGVLALWPSAIGDLLRASWAERTRSNPLHPIPPASRRVAWRRALGRGLGLDVRHALRLARHRPGVHLAAAGTLTLGVGAVTAMFAVLYGVVLHPLPYDEPDRLLAVRRLRPNGLEGSLSWHDVVRLREQARSFTGVAGYSTSPTDLVGVDEPERIDVARVTAGFFDVLGMRPALGRLLVAEDHGPDGRRVAVLDHGTWRSRFGRDSSAIGRAITLGDRGYTVVGVLDSAAVSFPEPTVEMYVPTAQNFSPGAFWLGGVARLGDGVTLAQAASELDLVQASIEAEFPELYADRSFVVRGLLAQVVGDVDSVLWALFAAGGLLLAAAFANVANLLLVHAASRRREMAARAALGASRFRLARQLVTESVMLSAVGLGGGVVLAQWTTRIVVALSPPMPRPEGVGVDGTVVAFAAAVALVVAVVFGLVPLVELPASRHGGLQRHGVRTTAPPRLRQGLVVLQIVAAFVLLAGAGLLMRSFDQLLDVDPGFTSENLLTFHVTTPASAFPARENVFSFHDELRASLSSIPGVTDVASASLVPFHGGNWCNTVASEPGDELIECAEFRTITPGYFDVLGVSVGAGRDFTASDDYAAPRVAIVNRAAARAGWGAADPIGSRFEMQDVWWMVVGVVGDVRQFGLDRAAAPAVYVPQPQYPLRYARYLVQSATPAAQLGPTVRARVRAIAPNVPVAEFATLESLVDRTVTAPRFRALVIGGVASLAFALAVVGVFAVISVSVAQRTRELGIRVALGASRVSVLRTVLGEGAALVAVGLAVGGTASVAAGRLIRGFLFEISPVDPIVFAAVALALAATGLGAAFLPARRATRVDPVAALRYE